MRYLSFLLSVAYEKRLKSKCFGVFQGIDCSAFESIQVSRKNTCEKSSGLRSYLLCLIYVLSLAVNSIWSVCSRGNSGDGLKVGGKCPRMNWLEHSKAHKDFTCQKKFLCSNFLYSLAEQKPSTTGAINTGYISRELA